jgi:hypothetical protein
MGATVMSDTGPIEKHRPNRRAHEMHETHQSKAGRSSM